MFLGKKPNPFHAILIDILCTNIAIVDPNYFDEFSDFRSIWIV